MCLGSWGVAFWGFEFNEKGVKDGKTEEEKDGFEFVGMKVGVC